MSIKFNLIKFAVALTLLFGVATAHAHRFHVGITDISMNAKTGNTEIIHSFMTHDIEALLDNLYQRPFDLSDADDIEIFRRYFEQHFAIRSADNTPYSIKWIGVQVTPQKFIIFQEIEHTQLSRGSIIRATALTDFLADQVNTLNVQHQSTLHTMSFSRTLREQNLP